MQPIDVVDGFRSVDLVDVEKVINEAMSALSMNERNQIQEEIHGVGSLCPQETPGMIEEALKSMQQELDSIPNKRVYSNISPFSYIHSKEFRLRFLRCELYNSKHAAERFVRFTEYMEEEFGIDTLKRPLCLRDLQKHCSRGKEVMDCFKVGHSQELPFRDRSGRKVLTTHMKFALAYEAELRVRSIGVIS
jgi:hypothetical protein